MAPMLFALALLAADPTTPVAADPAQQPPEAAVATQAAQVTDYLPKGAPADDYGFVAWCDGVLSGHMDLAAHLSDVLPLDDVQQSIGHAYLRAYGKAMATSPESKTEAGKQARDGRAARRLEQVREQAPGHPGQEPRGEHPSRLPSSPAAANTAAERLAHDPEALPHGALHRQRGGHGQFQLGGRPDRPDDGRPAPARGGRSARRSLPPPPVPVMAQGPAPDVFRGDRRPVRSARAGSKRLR